MKKNIILDVDPGVDDSIAMIYSFLAKQIEPRLICVTKGNKPIKQSTLNALYITENFSKTSPPVVQGAKESLAKHKTPSLNVHGKSGLGALINVSSTLTKTINRTKYGAEEAIRDCVNKFDNITYICTAPCSTLAKSVQKYPEIQTKIKQLIVMGGTISGKGSITPYASFNAYSDPEAFDFVTKLGIPTIISPSETGLSVFLQQPLLDKWETFGKYGSIVKKLYNGYHDLLLPTDKFATHDLCAVMSVTHPEYFEFKDVKIFVNTTNEKERGQTLFKYKESSNIKLITNANRNKIITELERVLKEAK